MISTNIVVVANRLPVTFKFAANGEREASVAPGGLVSALTPVAEKLQCFWVGWHDGRRVSSLHLNGMELFTLHTEPELYELYYQGFANQVLWPVFHGLSEYASNAALAEDHQDWWHAYQRVNEAFAARVAEVAQPGSLIWVQDYHLLLMPKLLRAIRPDLRIALFLHIPFPALEKLVPWRWAEELIQGIGGADLVGVQREQDAVRLRAAQDAFEEGRSPSIGVFPISIDILPFLDDARAALAQRTDRKLRRQMEIGDSPMLLSVDRLDYTKGIIERIEAFAEVLQGWSEPTRRPVLVQVLTPTREDVPAYEEHRERVEAAVAQVQKMFTTSDYVPIVTLAEPHSARALVDLYLAADVMCVTPIRDGMNLVAKEFVVSRLDELGVLVLSREAGAADELVEAVTVDPRDHADLVKALRLALSLPPEEVRARMRALRARVLVHDVHYWANSFLEAAKGGLRNDEPGVALEQATSPEDTAR